MPRSQDWKFERTGVPMEEALTPEQCEKMRFFLRGLVTYANRLPPGVKPRVGKFMQEWRRLVAGSLHGQQ